MRATIALSVGFVGCVALTNEEIRDWEAMFDLLRLSDEERERIMYGNAARIFGIIPTAESLPTREPAGAAAGDGS